MPDLLYKIIFYYLQIDSKMYSTGVERVREREREYPSRWLSPLKRLLFSLANVLHGYLYAPSIFCEGGMHSSFPISRGHAFFHSFPLTHSLSFPSGNSGTTPVSYTHCVRTMAALCNEYLNIRVNV